MRIEGYGTILYSKPFEKLLKLSKSSTVLYVEILAFADFEDNVVIPGEWVVEQLKGTKSDVFKSCNRKLSRSTFYRAWKNLESVGLITKNVNGKYLISMLAKKIDLVSFLLEEEKKYKNNSK